MKAERQKNAELNNNDNTRDKHGDSIYTKSLSPDSLPNKGCYKRCKDVDMDENLRKEGNNVTRLQERGSSAYVGSKERNL